MMFKYSLLCTILVFLAGNTKSQSESIGYGFRAGLSFAKIEGPSETGLNGETLESSKMASGFHIGMSINFKLTDIMGLRSELLYSQRGTDYLYEGPSYFILGRNTVQQIELDGNRKQTINVSNSYIDIPIAAYYKIGQFELSGGLNTGLLIASTGGGSIEFQGGSPISPFEINLNHNYKSDDAGFASATTQNVMVSGFNYAVPEFLGAYYDFDMKDGSFYKTLDFGLMGGLSYFLNEGLFLGVKYVHGLGDVDRNNYDVSLQDLNDNGTHIQRADINKSRSWQFSVGFSF